MMTIINRTGHDQCQLTIVITICNTEILSQMSFRSNIFIFILFFFIAVLVLSFEGGFRFWRACYIFYEFGEMPLVSCPKNFFLSIWLFARRFHSVFA